MNWFYWNTAWSLFFSLVWFMTITHKPDVEKSRMHICAMKRSAAETNLVEFSGGGVQVTSPRLRAEVGLRSNPGEALSASLLVERPLTIADAASAFFCQKGGRRPPTPSPRKCGAGR